MLQETSLTVRRTNEAIHHGIFEWINKWFLKNIYGKPWKWSETNCHESPVLKVRPFLLYSIKVLLNFLTVFKTISIELPQLVSEKRFDEIPTYICGIIHKKYSKQIMTISESFFFRIVKEVLVKYLIEFLHDEIFFKNIHFLLIRSKEKKLHKFTEFWLFINL